MFQGTEYISRNVGKSRVLATMTVMLLSGQDCKKVIIVTANELLVRRDHEDHK